MSKSDSIVNLAKALFKFQSAVTSISKDSSNPFFKSSYASLSHILEKIDPVLADAGLVLLQHPIGSNSDMVTLETVLIHASTGEFIQSEYSMLPVKKDPQSFGSCITYMRRYALVAILKLRIDDNDDDGNEASGKNDSGLTKKLEDKKEHRMSKEYMELCDKISLSQSKDELVGMVAVIQSSELSGDERNMLRKMYQAQLKKISEGA